MTSDGNGGSPNEHRSDDEYHGWKRPEGSVSESSTVDATDTLDPAQEPDPDEEWGPPPTMRQSLFRDRLRERFGVTPRQWYVIETIILVTPYPLFVAIYIVFPVNESLFIITTLAYSLFAIYVGFLS